MKAIRNALERDQLNFTVGISSNQFHVFFAAASIFGPFSSFYRTVPRISSVAGSISEFAKESRHSAPPHPILLSSLPTIFSHLLENLISVSDNGVVVAARRTKVSGHYLHVLEFLIFGFDRIKIIKRERRVDGGGGGNAFTFTLSTA